LVCGEGAMTQTFSASGSLRMITPGRNLFQDGK